MFRNQGGSSWKNKALLFAAAATVGGMASGAVLGLLGSDIPEYARKGFGVVLATVAVIVGAAELLGRPASMPQCSRETPQRWVHGGPMRWAAVNGLVLGNGAATRIGFWSWYLIPAACFLLGDAVLGALIYGCYGISRGTGAWALLAWNRLRRGTRFDDLAVVLLRRYPLARRLASLQLLALGALTLAGLSI